MSNSPIYGTGEDDLLYCTGGNDKAYGSSGNDIIEGKGGDDEKNNGFNPNQHAPLQRYLFCT